VSPDPGKNAYNLVYLTFLGLVPSASLTYGFRGISGKWPFRCVQDILDDHGRLINPLSQLQKILSNGLLNPGEYISVQPTIDKLVRSSRTEHVVKVLLDFISRLEILNRKKERGENREEVTVKECLQNALQKSKRPTLTSRLQTARKKGVDGDFPCLHVVVTPTRIALEGPNPEQVCQPKPCVVRYL
jgi:hypothetical protein